MLKIVSRLLELHPYYLFLSEIWDELGSVLYIHFRKNNFFPEKIFVFL